MSSHAGLVLRRPAAWPTALIIKKQRALERGEKGRKKVKGARTSMAVVRNFGLARSFVSNSSSGEGSLERLAFACAWGAEARV